MNNKQRNAHHLAYEAAMYQRAYTADGAPVTVIRDPLGSHEIIAWLGSTTWVAPYRDEPAGSMYYNPDADRVRIVDARREGAA